MRLLLETRNLLWTLSDDPQLSGKARKLIENAADIYVSAADGLFASLLRGRSGGTGQTKRHLRVAFLRLVFLRSMPTLLPENICMSHQKSPTARTKHCKQLLIQVSEGMLPM